MSRHFRIWWRRSVSSIVSVETRLQLRGAGESSVQRRAAGDASPTARLRRRSSSSASPEAFQLSQPHFGVKWLHSGWYHAAPATASTTASSSGEGGEAGRKTPEESEGSDAAADAPGGLAEGGDRRETDPRDPQGAVLQASLPHVLEDGWTEAAMLKGAKEAGLSPSVLALFPRREAHLVEYFMDVCRCKFEEEAEARAGELRAIPDLKQRLELVVRMRLEQQALYTSTWAQALSIQAQPSNLVRTVEQRNELVAALWAAAGELRPPLEAQALYALLGTVYTTSELYMLTDFSAGYEETWRFLRSQTTAALQAMDAALAVPGLLQQAALSLLARAGLGVHTQETGGFPGTATGGWGGCGPGGDAPHWPPAPGSPDSSAGGGGGSSSSGEEQSTTKQASCDAERSGEVPNAHTRGDVGVRECGTGESNTASASHPDKDSAEELSRRNTSPWGT